MALQAGDGSRMAEAARRARRTLQVGFTRRFRAPYRRLRAVLQQLDHNQFCAVSFELSFPGWDSRSGFLGDESRGGGVLDDVLSHQVDLVCWLLGASPDQVRAVQNGVQGAGVTAELKFGSLTARCRAAQGSYVELLEVGLNDGGGLEATGSYLRRKGSRPTPWRRHRALFLDKLALARDRLLRRTNVTLGSFELQLRDFEHAVHGEHFDGATAEEGVRAVEIVQACRTSIRNGGVWQATMSPA
jgi:predicted dehydrogenase